MTNPPVDYQVVSLEFDQSHLELCWPDDGPRLRIGPLRRELLSNDTIGGKQLTPLLQRDLRQQIGRTAGECESRTGWLLYSRSLSDVEFGCVWKALQQVLAESEIQLSSTRPHRLELALRNLRHPPTICFDQDGEHPVYVVVETASFTQQQMPFIRQMVERSDWPDDHWLLAGEAPPDSATVVVQFAENGPEFKQLLARRLLRGDFRDKHLILFACGDLDPETGQSRHLGLADQILDAGAAGVSVFDTVPDIQAFELLLEQMCRAMHETFLLGQSLTGDQLLEQILDRCQALADLEEAEYREQQRQRRQERRPRTTRKPTQ